ncbi:hypothetical protein ASG78_10685 [Nostocoides sp. Soil756]|jgi:uncharacterized protein (DUF488 family)|nr:hypothetical protein ASG78_10685 [Tetrasphaera sp. Soil756]
MLTFGHGRLDREELASLLEGAAVEAVVDVRRFPGSRTNAAASRGAVEDLAGEVGIAYRQDARLGGRRSLTQDDDAASPDTWWQVKAFRAYAGWTRSEEFRAGLADLLAEVQARRTAVMCSEAVWWRCHRRIISDVVAVEGGVRVEHLMHDRRLVEHRVSEGARLGPDGRLVWDAQAGGRTNPVS